MTIREQIDKRLAILRGEQPVIATHRGYCIRESFTRGTFSCDMINAHSVDTIADVRAAIDRYLDGDKDPQCKALEAKP